MSDRACCKCGRPGVYRAGRLYFCLRHADAAEDVLRRQAARADDREQRDQYDRVLKRGKK